MKEDKGKAKEMKEAEYNKEHKNQTSKIL